MATLVDRSAEKALENSPGALGDVQYPLNDLARGEMGVVRALTGAASFLSRMASLGFTPGAPVRMVQNYGRGALIVSIRGSRVALGRGEARRVRVVRLAHDELPQATAGDVPPEG
jgi:ferrous iron transport protein A